MMERIRFICLCFLLLGGSLGVVADTQVASAGTECCCLGAGYSPPQEVSNCDSIRTCHASPNCSGQTVDGYTLPTCWLPGTETCLLHTEPATVIIYNCALGGPSCNLPNPPGGTSNLCQLTPAGTAPRQIINCVPTGNLCNPGSTQFICLE